MRTLFVHTGGIGDFLLTCPALAALARDRAVTLAGHPDRLSLAVAAGVAERAVSLDAIDFGSLFSRVSPRLQAFAGAFDEAIVWMRDTDGAISSGLQRCGIHQVRCFPGLPQATWERHATAYYLECLGLPPGDDFRLTVPPEPRFGGWVLHPGSGGARKNWPVDHFEAVAARLARRGRKVHWCLGPVEEAIRVPDGVVPLRCESLVALAACLAAADGYVGNDSGISHLAAVVGCRTVAIFGPTDPAVWAPRGPKVTVAHGGPWPSVQDVLDLLDG